MSETVKTDGGPAFPGGSLKFDEGDCTTPYQIGMSLRDWLAGQALVALGTWTPLPQVENLFCDAACSSRARLAYMQADAMLVARAEGKS